MDITDINNIANDLAVLRSEINMAQAEYDAIIADNPDLKHLQHQIDVKKREKEVVQETLLVAMRDNSLRSWKTEEANFSRSFRSSVQVDPNYKKQVMGRIKEGEQVEGFALNETEFISIRAVK